ncbi:MAG TPA: hypothetical protein VI488_15750 [Candidatus Angelobacter sp.]
MKQEHLSKSLATGLATLAAAILALSPLTAHRAVAQNPNQAGAPASQLQERLAEVKESAAKNKQALAQYTWQEQQTTAVKGDVKSQKLFQVRLGPDGKPQKTETMGTPQSSGGHGVKGHIKEKKKEEFQEYGQQIGALAQQYAPDPQKLQQAYQQGNLMLASGGAPGAVKMVIKNYVKPNDQVTLIFNQQTKAIQSVEIQSYLSDPKDAVKIAQQYSQLPDGTSHVSTSQINGVSKDLLITTQNSNYQKL